MEMGVKKKAGRPGDFCLKRSLGTGLLVFAYLMTNVTGIYSTETNFWKDRRNAARHGLSTFVGLVGLGYLHLG